MDPRLIKGLTVLAAVALYVGAQWLPVDVAAHMRETAMLLLGWGGLRRPGDLAALPADAK